MLILALLAIATHAIWFLSGSILTQGDWFYTETTHGLTMELSSAWSFPEMGRPFLGTAFIPVYILSYPVSQFFGFAGSERIFYMWPIALGVALFSFIFVRYLTGSSTGAFFASLFYSYSTFGLAMQGVGLLLMLTYALAPLCLYLFIRGIRERKLFFILLNVLLVSYTAFLDFRGTFLLVLALAFVALLHAMQGRQWRWPLGALLLTGLLVMLINLFWLANLLVNHGLDNFQGIAFGLGLVGDSYQGIQYALNLANPFWTGVLSPESAIAQPISPWNWLVPAFLILSLWFVYKEKNPYLRFMVLGFIGMGFVAVFLGKVTRPPLSWVYPLVFQYVPGFAAFRETGKFYILASFSLLVPLGYAAARLFENAWLMRHAKVRIFLLVAVASILLYNARPLVTGEMDTLFVAREIPSAYPAFNDMVRNDPSFYRTFWLPTFSRYTFTSITHPYTSFTELTYPTGGGLLGQITNSDPRTAGLLWPDTGLWALKQPFASFFLSSASVRYVGIPDDYPPPAKPEVVREIERSYYAHALSGLDYLKLKYNDAGLWVFENPHYNDHLYVAHRAVGLPLSEWYNQSNLDAAQDVITDNLPNATWLQAQLPRAAAHTTLAWAAHGASEYEINATSSGPFLMVFSETYHPDWNLYVLQGHQTFQWWDVLIRSPPAAPHVQVNGWSQAFWVEPCEESCRMVMFYKPQAYLLLGGMLSALFSALTLVALYLSWKKGWTFPKD